MTTAISSQTVPAVCPVEAGSPPPASTPVLPSPKRGRGRPKGSVRANNATLSPHILINDQRVTWSMIKYVYKRLHCDWDNTIDAFWKARNATGSNGIYRYIMSGFTPGKKGPAWIHLPSRDREEGKMESIRQWWFKLYVPSSKNKATIAINSDEVKNMLESLSEKFGI
ncbi:MAG: hypothetical protein WC898_02310 [Candidatus Paceibacterota bacterium]|jgi:hypothetical protein